MSFILDALKKSESERKRQGGPALLEMRVSPPRRGLPVWAVLIAIALLANLGILAYLLLRPPAAAAPAAVTASTAPPAATAPTAAPIAPAVTAPTMIAPPPVSALPDPATVTSALPAATSEGRPPANAADYEPAVQPQAGQPSSTTIAADMGLPTMQDLNAGGAGIPELRLSLHAYDPVPANRYVLLNSRRLREGDATTEGVRLERITEFGAVLSWRGRRFTLQRGE